MPNVVEIIVRARDMTGEGFGKAEAKATGLGAALTRFAAVGAGALAVVGFESVRMASKFDQSMELLSTQAGVPQAKIAGLKNGVLALASQVGFSPDSLAESLFHAASNMASLGATGPQMLNLVKVAAEGAKVGNADLVDVTNALTAAVASGIPGVKNYQQAMGMLNATVGAGDMKMQDLAEAFGGGMVATVKGFGLTLKDVGAALAVFGDNNIRGAHAGTQLRMSVMALAAPAKYGQALLKSWGESADQLSKDMRSGGLMKALDDLAEHFRKAGIGAKEQGEVITNMFGKKAGAGLNVLMDQLDRLRSKYPDITKGASGFGDAWQKTLQQTSTVLSQLKGWFDALMISIGEKLLPAVKSFGQWMLNNKTAIEITLAVVAGLVAVLGTYVTIVKTVVVATKIWEAVQAILNGEMEMNPIGLIVTAIAALVIGFMEAYKHSKAFRDIIHDVGEAAKVAFRWVLNSAKEAWDWITSHWSGLVHDLTGPFDAAVAWITGAYHHIMNGIADVVNFIQWHWRLIIAIMLGPVGLVIDAISAHWRTIMRGLADVVDFIRTQWNQMVRILSVPVRIAADLIMYYFRMLRQAVTDVVTFVRGGWDALYNVLSGPVRKAVSVIVALFRLVWRAALDVVNFIQRGWDELYGILIKPVKSAYDMIMGWFHDIESWLSDLPGKIASAIPGGGVLHNVASFFGMGTGGIAGAATGGVHGGLRLVGEYGPELVRMPYGSTVFSNAQSQGMLGGGGEGGGITVQIDLTGGDDMLLRWLRQRIRVVGGTGPGSVQRALGAA